MKIRVLALLLIISGLFSCKNRNNTNQVAKALCDCLRPIVQVYRETQQLSEEDTAADLEAAMEKMERAAEESDACAERLDGKYGDLTDREEEVEAAMQRVCPDVAAAMEEIENAQ